MRACLALFLSACALGPAYHNAPLELSGRFLRNEQAWQFQDKHIRVEFVPGQGSITWRFSQKAPRGKLSLPGAQLRLRLEGQELALWGEPLQPGFHPDIHLTPDQHVSFDFPLRHASRLLPLAAFTLEFTVRTPGGERRYQVAFQPATNQAQELP
jgi:hypothetical protein